MNEVTTLDLMFIVLMILATAIVCTVSAAYCLVEIFTEIRKLRDR